MIDLDEIIGQEEAVGRLMSNSSAGRMPHAMLFAGPRGVGRCSTAAALAKLLLCKSPASSLLGQPKACNACESCRLMNADTHPDFAIVKKELAKYHEDAAVRSRVMQDLGIDVIRSFLIDPAYKSPLKGKGRVFVVEETDLMSIAAQNSLLKTLEEPPAGVTIILLTDKPDQLLPTTRSRCAFLRFVPLPHDFVVQKLAENGTPDDEAKFWAAFTDGSVGLAIEYANQELYPVKRQLIGDLAKLAGGYVPLGDEWAKIADTMAEAQVAAAKKADGADMSKNLATRQVTGIMLRLMAGAFTDALTLSAGANRPLVHCDQPQEIHALAQNHSPADIAAAIEQLSEYERLLWRNVNAKTVWDNVAISCTADAGAAAIAESF